jgi:hypothetical protein
MKHVGKMKNNSARVVIVYRTLPGDPHHCVVVGVQGLGDSYHDTLMTLVESDSGQQAGELADILAARRFPDGTVMLGFLHNNGHLKRIPTNSVLVTPDNQSSIQLDKLNEMIAEQKGVTVEDLAVSDGSGNPIAKTKTKQEVIVDDYTPPNTSEDFSPASLRSKADKLFKEAQLLRKKADEMDPPKSKSKKLAATAE